MAYKSKCLLSIPHMPNKMIYCIHIDYVICTTANELLTTSMACIFRIGMNIEHDASMWIGRNLWIGCPGVKISTDFTYTILSYCITMRKWAMFSKCSAHNALVSQCGMQRRLLSHHWHRCHFRIYIYEWIPSYNSVGILSELYRKYVRCRWCRNSDTSLLNVCGI